MIMSVASTSDPTVPATCGLTEGIQSLDLSASAAAQFGAVGNKTPLMILNEICQVRPSMRCRREPEEVQRTWQSCAASFALPQVAKLRVDEQLLSRDEVPAGRFGVRLTVVKLFPLNNTVATGELSATCGDSVGGTCCVMKKQYTSAACMEQAQAKHQVSRTQSSMQRLQPFRSCSACPGTAACSRATCAGQRLNTLASCHPQTTPASPLTCLQVHQPSAAWIHRCDKESLRCAGSHLPVRGRKQLSRALAVGRAPHPRCHCCQCLDRLTRTTLTWGTPRGRSTRAVSSLLTGTGTSSV